jgi:tetratricopeptide (TPR) repeat protein
MASRPGSRSAPAAARTAAALGVLWLVAFGLYAGTLDHPFVFDDIDSIERNPDLRRLWPPAAPPGSGASGRPLVALSLAVNYALGGLDPTGYHLFNIAAHGLAAGVLFLLLRGTLRRARWRPEAAGALAFAAALLWVVHPLHTGALNHVVYRNEILAALFYLAALEALRRGAAAQDAGRRGAARLAFAAAVAAAALAMASKEIAVSLPLAALLYDRLFAAGSWRVVRRRRAAVHLALAGTWIGLAACIASGDRGASVGMHFQDVTPRAYALTSFAVVAHYLRLALWPRPLVLDYAWPVSAALAPVLPQMLLVIGLWAATLVAWRRAPRLAFPAIVFFLVLAPTSSLVPLAGAVAAEHRMYLPLAAVATLAVLAADAGLRHLVGSASARRGLAALLLVLAAAALGGATWSRNRDYASALAIWADTVAKRPANARARGNLGTAQLQAGAVEAAAASYAEMVRLDPDNPDARANWAMALLRLGRREAARRELEQAVRLAPRSAQPRYDLGLLERAAGDLRGAAREFEAALQLDPAFAPARHDLATARLALGETAAAQMHLRRYLEARPDDVAALNNLAWTLATAADSTLRSGEEALRRAERAVRLAPAPDPQLLDTLAAAQAECGRFAAAAATAGQARDLAAAAGQTELAARLEARARLYGSGQAFRAPPPARR